ncbi:MAG: hypothetical protein LBG47_04775, partial [Prevotellaceae bacterium]|nr:hypothetical protein [Prevotellaceae bacterium]
IAVWTLIFFDLNDCYDWWRMGATHSAVETHGVRLTVHCALRHFVAIRTRYARDTHARRTPCVSTAPFRRHFVADDAFAA